MVHRKVKFLGLLISASQILWPSICDFRQFTISGSSKTDYFNIKSTNDNCSIHNAFAITKCQDAEKDITGSVLAEKLLYENSVIINRCSKNLIGYKMNYHMATFHFFANADPLFESITDRFSTKSRAFYPEFILLWAFFLKTIQ